MKTGLLVFVGILATSFSVAPAHAARLSHARAHNSAPVRSHRLFARNHTAPKAPAGAEVDAIRGLIAKHAAENGVPFKLADAVARIESTYKPNVSNGGALGLMQIKPGTAHDLGFVGSSQELYDAETNIRFGVKFLAQVYRKSGGDLCGTVMRYQSGAYTKHMNAANRAYCSKARAIMIELAWRWLRFQPDSQLSIWFRERVGNTKGRIRRIAIVAVARKLLIALWRYLESGVIPTGALLKGATG